MGRNHFELMSASIVSPWRFVARLTSAIAELLMLE